MVLAANSLSLCTYTHNAFISIQSWEKQIKDSAEQIPHSQYDGTRENTVFILTFDYYY